MKKKNFLSASKKFIFLYIPLFLCLFSSCVSQRNLEYLQDKNKSAIKINESEFTDYQLQPFDALYIQISSLDDAASNVFAQSGGQQITLDPYSAYLRSYTIDKDGYVQIPVIGKVKVSGITTVQVCELIKDSVENILSLPVVMVKLVNQYVSVLGEVRNPGHYTYSQDKFSIYNALSIAGDVTPYGNRKQIILIRNENGKNIQMDFDLTKSDILSSKYYYIKPNDMIYVKPLRKRFWGMEQFPFNLVFTTITTGLLIYTIIQQQ